MSYQASAGYIDGPEFLCSDSATAGAMTITCTSLASGTGTAATGCRQSSKYLGTGNTGLVQVPPGGATATMPDELAIDFKIQGSSSFSAGDHVDLFLSFSDSSVAGTHNQGGSASVGVTGTDAAGPNFDIQGQLVFVGSIPCSPTAGTSVQENKFVIHPSFPYFSACVYNGGAVTFDSTAAHTVITFTPRYTEQQT